jgi:hypothetical protein
MTIAATQASKNDFMARTQEISLPPRNYTNGTPRITRHDKAQSDLSAARCESGLPQLANRPAGAEGFGTRVRLRSHFVRATPDTLYPDVLRMVAPRVARARRPPSPCGFGGTASAASLVGIATGSPGRSCEAAKAGGPGRTRTCNQTDGTSTSAADFCCAFVWVRSCSLRFDDIVSGANWCGGLCALVNAGTL